MPTDTSQYIKHITHSMHHGKQLPSVFQFSSYLLYERLTKVVITERRCHACICHLPVTKGYYRQ